MICVASIMQWKVALYLVHKPFAHMSIDGSRYKKQKTHETPNIASYGYSGLMELTQYTEAYRRSPELVLNMTWHHPQFVKPSAGYAVTVSVICGVKHPVTNDEKRGRRAPLATERGTIDSCQDDGVFLRITERYSGDTKSTGGSSFRVISTTPLARKMCSYVDLFDGTYLVWCPFLLGSECSNMSVSLDFVNFTAYTGKHIPLCNVVWQQAVCRGQQSLCTDEGGLAKADKTLLHRTNLPELQYETATRNANLTKADVVLIQMGAHTMAFNGLQKTITAAVPAFSRVLRKVSEVSRTRGFRVVYVTSPAYPRRCNEKLGRGSRNNFALAAYQSSVMKAIVATGFEIFDEFSAFLPHEEEAVCGVCGAHYLCRKHGVLDHVWGEMGKTGAEILLAYATRKQEDDRQPLLPSEDR